MGIDVGRIIESLKGIAGSGNILSGSIKNIEDCLRTLEPGDIIRKDPPLVIAAPIGYDLWYLWTHANFLARHYDNIDGDHFDYSQYIANNLDFLSNLPGLKPLKIFRDLAKGLLPHTYLDIYSMTMRTDWANNGVYWINTMAFELCPSGISEQCPSNKPSNDYVGYLTFPVGQLGVMETISLIQETELGGYKFAGVDGMGGYWDKAALSSALPEKDKPTIQSTPEMFPDMKDSKGNILAGQNCCFGRHIIEDAYLIPNTPVSSQNKMNSSGGTAYAPTPKQDVELFSSEIEEKKYGEDVKPKFWMRYWIHKDNTLPVPGEFLGVLCRSVACPPHVWWFQESSPFVYAGNWMETFNFTSGIVTKVILGTDRDDDGIGNIYTVKIQGCEVIIYSTDFYNYVVGDRVTIIKVKSTIAKPMKSFTWIDQQHLKKMDLGARKDDTYIIMPATFYKKKR